MNRRFNDQDSCVTCGVFVLNDDRQTMHSEWHNSIGQTLPDPEPPTPVWRQKVDKAAEDLPDEPERLAYVLDLLSYIAARPDSSDTWWRLALIVAVCEAEVGDDWKADPDHSTYDARDAWGLLLCLTAGGEKEGPREVDLWFMARAAARWLRNITEES